MVTGYLYLGPKPGKATNYTKPHYIVRNKPQKSQGSIGQSGIYDFQSLLFTGLKFSPMYNYNYWQELFPAILCPLAIYWVWYGWAKGSVHIVNGDSDSFDYTQWHWTDLWQALGALIIWFCVIVLIQIALVARMVQAFKLLAS